ncbi:MAG: DUF488 domain-containing protein [Proteobacteria bacterium]|nr:DUF488 domain-containing protein [Pseudomonadota bacterium]
MRPPFLTVGHSNRSLPDFIGLLKEAGVARVVDIRKLPRSRSNPQFNQETLAGALAPAIGYEHLQGLGGRRAKVPRSSPEVNGFWTNRSFHNYADYALTAPFHAAFAHLLEQGRHRCCAIMCAEAVWWRCHRRIVTDYLLAHGETVLHIMGPGRLEPAHLTAGALIQPAGTVVYPAAPPGEPA